MEGLKPYVYEALNLKTDSIRLLRFHGFDDRGRITCALRTAKRSESAYVALSYAWGADSNEAIIVVNGKALRVRRNLHNFLQRYCHQLSGLEEETAGVCADKNLLTSPLDEASCSKYHEYHFTDIWIDTICLNQKNVKERNHQVQQMFQIYRDAQGVLAWLGETDDDTIAWLSEIQDWALRRQAVADPYTNVKHTLLEPVSLSETVSPFLNLSYWKRVWIVQELAAARHITMIVGPLELAWDNFWSAIEMATLAGNTRQVYVESFAYRHYDFRVSPHGVLSLWDLLEKFKIMECSDVRDRIYGLYSFAAESSCIAVNYNISLTELAVKVATACLPLKSQSHNIHAFTTLLSTLEVSTYNFELWSTDSSLRRLLQRIKHPQSGFVIYVFDVPQSVQFCPTCKTRIAPAGSTLSSVSAIICVRTQGTPVHILGPLLLDEPYEIVCGEVRIDERSKPMWLGPLQDRDDYEKVNDFLERALLREITPYSHRSIRRSLLCYTIGPFRRITWNISRTLKIIVRRTKLAEKS